MAVSGPNIWFFRVWVRNARVPVAKVEYRLGAGSWATPDWEGDGAWQASGADFSGGFSLRVTSIDGQALEDAIPGLGTFDPNAGIRSHGNSVAAPPLRRGPLRGAIMHTGYRGPGLTLARRRALERRCAALQPSSSSGGAGSLAGPGRVARGPAASPRSNEEEGRCTGTYTYTH